MMPASADVPMTPPACSTISKVDSRSGSICLKTSSGSIDAKAWSGLTILIASTATWLRPVPLDGFAGDSFADKCPQFIDRPDKGRLPLEQHVVAGFQGHQTRTGNPFGNDAAAFMGNGLVVTRMKHQRRGLHPVQQGRDIDMAECFVKPGRAGRRRCPALVIDQHVQLPLRGSWNDERREQVPKRRIVTAPAPPVRLCMAECRAISSGSPRTCHPWA